MVALLIESIVKEMEQEQLYHHKIIQQIVNTLIMVVARNIALKLPKKVKENTGRWCWIFFSIYNCILVTRKN